MNLKQPFEIKDLMKNLEKLKKKLNSYFKLTKFILIAWAIFGVASVLSVWLIIPFLVLSIILVYYGKKTYSTQSKILEIARKIADNK